MSRKLADAYDQLHVAVAHGSPAVADRIDRYAWALREEVLTEIGDEISFLRDCYADTIARLAFDLVETKLRQRIMDRDDADPADDDADDADATGDNGAWGGGFASNH